MKQNADYYSNVYKKGYGVQFPESHLIRIHNYFVKDLLPQKDNLKVLDFGCGNGVNGIFYSSQGFNIYGVDIIPQAIENAKEILPNYADNFITVDNSIKLNELFSGTKFDMIIANQSLYYLNDSDLQHKLKELDYILSDNGIVIFTMMDKNNNYYQLRTGEEDKGLEEVKNIGRLKENGSSWINFVNQTEMLEKFNTFQLIKDGEYNITAPEGDTTHLFFVGKKK